MEVRDPESGGQGLFSRREELQLCRQLAGFWECSLSATGTCAGLTTENDCLGSLEAFSVVCECPEHTPMGSSLRPHQTHGTLMSPVHTWGRPFPS